MSPGARMPARRAPLLVRRRDIDDQGTHAGRFRDVALAPRLLPGALTRTTGWFCLDTDERVVALTFDDGPHPIHTPGILSALERHGAQATFFVLAGPARRHPEIVRRAVAEGHEVGLHGGDHRSLKTLSALGTLRMLRESKRTVEAASGTRVTLYRPPYLHYHAWQLALIRLTGLTLAMASGAPGDWLHDEESAIAERGIACLFPGAMLLLHDDRGDPETTDDPEDLPRFDRAEVVDRILAEGTARGYEFVTVSELTTRARGVSSLLRNT